MARLYDRVLSEGCRPLTAGLLYGQAKNDPGIREAYGNDLRASGIEPTPEAVDNLIRGALAQASQARAATVFDRAQLKDAAVIAADEVGEYFAGFPLGTQVSDIVSVLAPPFDRFFVEFVGVQNPVGLYSWGVLFEILQRPSDDRRADRPEDAWVVLGTMVAEWRKGQPVGPIITWLLPLDSDGYLHPGDDEGHGALFGRLVEIEGMPEEQRQPWANYFVSTFAPALLTISFMHCKNVDVVRVDPPPKLSRRAARQRGNPLTSYYVLDIQPMRRVLDTEGEAQARGLRHALHICRGHFKTFTEEAPLFGRHVGTYWWEAQARGTTEMGVIEKDYRVRLDEGLGREYVEADEHPEIRPQAPEHTGRDPDLGGRGLRAHNVTQNLLASAVERAGFTPRRPKPEEPQYDLAWETAEAVVWVAEVKSITPENEERQLRLAVGQIVRYRQLLATDGRTVRAMIVSEREPSDSTWADLCTSEEILLSWPGNLDDSLI
jgi:hypothetical protein